MSLFDSASLVVTPNGYKEDKLYSIKPTDGSGDLVVTRATTATRVNSDGLIEVTPYNLAQYSNTFTNAIWQKVSGSGGSIPIVTANYGISPSGLNNATRIQLARTSASGSASVVRQAITITPNVTHTQSVWLKSLSGTPSILIADNGGVFLNLITLTNEWVRYELPFSNSFNFCNFDFALSQNIAGSSLSADFLVYGAQLVSGTSAKEYFPTTDRLDIPRLDYTNSSCPSILVEPQRTNLVPNPFSYSGSGVAFNTSVVNSPISDGLSTRITKNEAAGTLRYAQQTCSSSALLGSTNYTISAFFKYDGYDVQTSMEYNNSGQWGTTSWVQLINIASTGITLGTSSACTSTIQNYGNGWYRVNVTILTGATITSTPPVTYLMRVASTLSTGQGFLHTAAQLEAGSYATSYIPTVASSVTRNADVISKTGISSLIGQTEGTIFVDFNLSTIGNLSGSGIIELTPAGGAEGESNRIILYKGVSSKQIGFQIRAGGTTNIFNYLFSAPPDGKVKIGIAYKSGDTALSVNGVIVQRSETFTFSQTLNFIKLGASLAANIVIEDRINSAILWKERLSNETLAQLTTI